MSNRRNLFTRQPLRMITLFLPAVVVLLLWQMLIHFDSQLAFFIGSPELFVKAFLMEATAGTQVGNLQFPFGKIFVDTAITGSESIAGFLAGSLAGTLLGLWLSRSAFVSSILRPYVIGLGTAPLFAFAPIIVLWFGIGFTSKVVVAALSCIFVALMQAFKGAVEADPTMIQVAQSFGATDRQTFRKVVVPSAAVWVINGFRLNIGFALLGAFLAEFINSSNGLGHLILVAEGLYNIPLVLVGVAMISLLGLILNAAVDLLEPMAKKLLSSTL